MKVFLDDVRNPPDGWILCRWPHEVIELLKTNNVTHLSLDHDLGDDSIGDGYDVILWIEKAVVTESFNPPHITVHSANVAAVKRMLMGIESINSLIARRKIVK